MKLPGPIKVTVCGLVLAVMLLVAGVVQWLFAARVVQGQPVLSTEGQRVSILKIVEQVLNGDGGAVCDAIALPTKSSDGSSIVIASIDYSGRHFCNEIIRIQTGERPSILQRFDTWWTDNLSAVVQDLDGDGNVELVVPHPDSFYEGAAACVATTPVIYKCAAATCSNVTFQHPEFLARQLDERQRELAATQVKGPGEDRRRVPCLMMEIAKIRRLLGVGPQEGFQLAEEWMKSPDPILRRKAIAVFADINDDASRQRLQTLSNDTDPAVAQYAQTIASRK